jgi:hypothetical protein
MRLTTCEYEGDGDCSHEQRPGERFCAAHAHRVELVLGLVRLDEAGSPRPGADDPAADTDELDAPDPPADRAPEPATEAPASDTIAPRTDEPRTDEPSQSFVLVRIAYIVGVAMIAAVVALLIILLVG